MRIGIIGSTGIRIELLSDEYQFESVDIGTKQFKFYRGKAGGKEIILTARNQYGGSVPPHEVDYKLIMQGMARVQADVIVGTAMTGSLKHEIAPGTYLVLDQFLDFTKRTPHTIFDEDEFAFVDFAEPFCPVIRKNLIRACEEAGVTFCPEGCYVGVDGPRYETGAEVRMYAQLGGDIVGMTNVTEAIMARETGQCYAALCLVVNYGAGLGAKKEILRKDCYDRTMENLDHTVDILKRFIRIYDGEKTCDCHSKISDMLRKTHD